MTKRYDWSQHKVDLSHLRDADFTDEHGVYNFEKASEAVEEAFRKARRQSLTDPSGESERS